MKTRVNVYLSEEALELADRLAKEQGVSRSAIIDRRITQTQTPRADTNTNSPNPNTKGYKEMLDNFLKILNKDLLEDRQQIFKMIEEDHTEIIKIISPATRKENSK